MTSRDSSKWRACLQATIEMQRKHSWAHVVSFVSVGFLKRLVSDIWTVFEGGQDRRPAPPRIKHVDSIDSRSYNKVCWMLSSYWLLPVGEIDGTYRLSINKPFQFQKYQKLQTKKTLLELDSFMMKTKNKGNKNRTVFSLNIEPKSNYISLSSWL